MLTSFDGHRWSRDRATARRPPVVKAAQGWDYQIDYEPTDRRLLVALDCPAAHRKAAVSMRT